MAVREVTAAVQLQGGLFADVTIATVQAGWDRPIFLGFLPLRSLFFAFVFRLTPQVSFHLQENQTLVTNLGNLYLLS